MAYYSMIHYLQLNKEGVDVQRIRNLTRSARLLEILNIKSSNEAMGHLGSRQSSLPSAAIRTLGGYVASSTASWTQYRDGMAIFNDAASIPKDHITVQGSAWADEVFATHRMAFGMSIEEFLLYGTATLSPDTYIKGGSSVTPTMAPEKFDGLAARYKTPDNGDGTYSPFEPDPSTAAQAGVFDMAGSGTDTTSIWFIESSDMGASLIVPKNHPTMGIDEINDGWVDELDSSDHSKRRKAYRKQWEWWCGLTIADVHNVARLRNIETALSSIDSSMIGKIYQILAEWFVNATETVWIVIPPRLDTFFRILLESKTNVTYSTDNPYGAKLMSFEGPNGRQSPIVVSQAISIGETAVAAV